MKEATCTANGARGCSVCGTTESIAKLPHTETTVPGVNATCTQTGLTAGKKCSVCGEELVKQDVIPAKGHSAVVDPGYPATCDADGLTDGKHCSVCGTVLVPQEVIPAYGHDYRTRRVKATLTKGGYTRYTCSNCGYSYVAHRTESYAAGIGSIVFNAADEAMPYTMTEDGATCIITAEADANGAYTLRKLVLAESLINDLKEMGKTEVRFVVGEYALVIPMDLPAGADEYVFTVDGMAEGGCLVKAESVSGETAQDAAGTITGMKLCRGENEIAVTETMVYVVSAQ